MDDRVGAGQVETDTARLQRKQEQGYFAVLETLHGFGAIARFAGERDVA